MLQPASITLRSIYILSLAVIIYPVATMSWMGFSNSAGAIGAILSVVWIGFAGLGVWRIFQVVTKADTLDSYVYSGIVKLLRAIGIIGMVLSLLYLVIQIGLGVYLSLLDPKSGSGSAPLVVAGLFVALLAGFAQLGLWIFEVSRLFGFERNSRGEN